ncbi:MAG: hypothetical protein ACR5KV_01165 [Wolbachia sp.]
MYCDDNSLVRDDKNSPILFTIDWNLSENPRYIFFKETYDGVKERIRISSVQKIQPCILPAKLELEI